MKIKKNYSLTSKQRQLIINNLPYTRQELNQYFFLDDKFINSLDKVNRRSILIDAYLVLLFNSHEKIKEISSKYKIEEVKDFNYDEFKLFILKIGLTKCVSNKKSNSTAILNRDFVEIFNLYFLLPSCSFSTICNSDSYLCKIIFFLITKKPLVVKRLLFNIKLNYNTIIENINSLSNGNS